MIHKGQKSLLLERVTKSPRVSEINASDASGKDIARVARACRIIFFFQTGPRFLIWLENKGKNVIAIRKQRLPTVVR